MTAHDKGLKDFAQRATATLAHDRTLLVEAGAGSGKTALMAGRIALMLAAGVSPSTIAAVTFTELAASELLSRVRQVVIELLAGRITKELKTILPQGRPRTKWPILRRPMPGLRRSPARRSTGSASA